MYRRDIASQIGCYIKPYQASDFHSIIRLIMMGNIIINNNEIGIWRVHSNNTTIKEVKRKQKDAMQTFDDIEEFAKQYFSLEELKKWRKGMNRSSYLDYVSTYVHCRRNIKSLLLIISAFRFKKNYLRLWFYFFFNY